MESPINTNSPSKKESRFNFNESAIARTESFVAKTSRTKLESSLKKKMKLYDFENDL